MPGTSANLCCESEGGAITVGCGLTGDGSAATPLAVAPAAGEETWPWTQCTAADASTLRCDPNTGEMWTPPEHDSDIDAAPPLVAAPGGAGPFGPTPGPVFPPGLSQAFSLTEGARLGGCRTWSALHGFGAQVEVSWTAGTTFQVGYLMYENGVAAGFVPIGGVTNANAGGQLFNGSVVRWTGLRQADEDHEWLVQAAIDVVAGQIFIEEWTIDRWLVPVTRADAA